MTDALQLRRSLYATLPHVPRRRRRHVRRLIAQLSTGALPSGDDGSAGVREPRRPLPPPPGQSTSAL